MCFFWVWHVFQFKPLLGCQWYVRLILCKSLLVIHMIRCSQVWICICCQRDEDKFNWITGLSMWQAYSLIRVELGVVMILSRLWTWWDAHVPVSDNVVTAHKRSCSCFYKCLSFCPPGAGGGMMSLPVRSHVPWRVWSPRGYSIPYPLVLTSSGCHRSGRYTSYWNALLLVLLLQVRCGCC